MPAPKDEERRQVTAIILGGLLSNEDVLRRVLAQHLVDGTPYDDVLIDKAVELQEKIMVHFP